MSSDILLQEVAETVKGLTVPLSTQATTKDELQALLVKQQVRMGSLRRQQELAVKLCDELPDRISEITEKSKELGREVSELQHSEQRQKQDIEKMKLKQIDLEKKVSEIMDLITSSREEETVKKFQINNAWHLINRVTDMRRAMSLAQRMADPGPRSEGDFDYLSARIEHNEKVIREIESHIH